MHTHTHTHTVHYISRYVQQNLHWFAQRKAPPAHARVVKCQKHELHLSAQMADLYCIVTLCHNIDEARTHSQACGKKSKTWPTPKRLNYYQQSNVQSRFSWKTRRNDIRYNMIMAGIREKKLSFTCKYIAQLLSWHGETAVGLAIQDYIAFIQDSTLFTGAAAQSQRSLL